MRRKRHSVEQELVLQDYFQKFPKWSIQIMREIQIKT